MALRENISSVYTLVGDIGERHVQRGEVILYLNDAQDMMASILANIVREKFLTKATIDLVNGQEVYDLPADFQDPVRVTMRGFECNRMGYESLAALDRNTQFDPVTDRQQFYYIYGGSGWADQVGVRPIPTAAVSGGLVVSYFRKAVPFTLDGYEKRTAAAAGTTTALVSSALNAAGSPTKTGQNDFWNNAKLTFTTGNNAGISRRVTDFAEDDNATTFTTDSGGTTTTAIASGAIGTDVYTGLYIECVDGANAGEVKLITGFNVATGEFTVTDAFSNAVASGVSIAIRKYGLITLSAALPNAVASGDEFWVEQVTIIPEEYEHIMVLYAASLAAGKVPQQDPAYFYGRFKEAMGQVTAKWSQNVDPPLTGDPMKGVK